MKLYEVVYFEFPWVFVHPICNEFDLKVRKPDERNFTTERGL